MPTTGRTAVHADPTLVRWLFDAIWSRGQTSDLSQRHGPHTFHHRDRTMELDTSRLAGLVEGWRTGFPDLEFRVVDLVADGDLGVMMFFRFDETGLVEAWELDDMAALEAQLDEAGCHLS